MTPTFGWSLDLTRLRRSGAILCALLVAATFGATGVQAGGYDPARDVDSMASTTEYTGAQAWWAAGYTGKGIDVALIDSGVVPVEGLAGRGKLVYGPDLSLESQSENLTDLDTFGHGTFMAGLIAGRDDGITAPYDEAPTSAYLGMAPGARIVSLKVATADGGVDVSQVIAAIDWVTEHHDDPGLNIRVINLSYGTNSKQSYKVDPLAFAVEQAWNAGIVVVAAAGNSGFQRGHGSPALANPAADRRIIAVGASDSMDSPTMADDTVPEFSAGPRGGTARGPDLLAPGVHLQGLRVPNSYIDTHVKTAINDRFMRGSGTSESAAITSGAVALILDKYPNATPDQVKRLLKQSAFELPANRKPGLMGSGELQLDEALAKGLPQDIDQPWAPARGGGSLELARGTDHITIDGVILEGEQDIFGATFDADAMADREATGRAWTGGRWNGNRWYGAPWTGNSWSGNSWSGSSWSGNSWSGNSWSGSSWSGNSWSGSSWSGNSWSGNSWSADSWS